MSARAADEVVTVPLTIPRSMLTTIAAPPELISQVNAEATAGLPKRAYLRLAREFALAGGEVSAIGKLRLVDRVAFLAWLRRRSAAPEPANDAAPDPVAALANELGLKAAGGGR